MRIGYGYDVHRLVGGRKLILGGVDIPSDLGLQGHSDADVLIHAIADALLGAAALGDIGHHFPDTDPGYKNISSVTFLEVVKSLIHKHEFVIVNVDSTVCIERPRIASHIAAMRSNISRALGIDVNSVSVKATTGEGIGFVGKGEGACAHAVVLVEKRTGGAGK